MARWRPLHSSQETATAGRCKPGTLYATAVDSGAHLSKAIRGPCTCVLTSQEM